MQYERLAERAHQPQERMFAEHMQTVGDMDFFVTAVRRLLRTAAAAEKIHSEEIDPKHHAQLKLAVKVFDSQWGDRLKGIRDALEHVESVSTGFPVPMVSIPTDGDGDGEFILMGPHGNLNLAKVYEDARSIAKAIARIVALPEAETAPST
jgi:hypothetical protein